MVRKNGIKEVFITVPPQKTAKSRSKSSYYFFHIDCFPLVLDLDSSMCLFAEGWHW